MADRDIWEKGESLSKIFAAVLIPVVIGIAGLYANQALEKSKTRDELLKQAIDVVFLSKSDQMAGADKSFESRRAHRSHWLEIYNNLSDVKLSDAFIAVMFQVASAGAARPLPATSVSGADGTSASLYCPVAVVEPARFASVQVR